LATASRPDLARERAGRRQLGDRLGVEIAVAVISRNPPSRSARDTGRAMSRENVEVVRRAISAYNERDFEAIRALNHPEVEVDWSASRGLEARIYQGQEDVMRFMQSFLGMFEQVKMEPVRFIESGDSVVVPNCTQLRGRDGIETVARSALVFEVRSGRIARIGLYQETREALEAVGLRE
jgi:ketosteroid isomerase-like protein